MPPTSLDKLRAQIKHIEGRTSTLDGSGNSFLARPEEHPTPSPLWSFGVREVDQFFPKGLCAQGLHEITPVAYKDSWATLSFALALASLRARFDQRPLLWCSSSFNKAEFGGLYGQGLQRFDLDPARFILIETKNEHETAFVLAEALKSSHLCAVIGLIKEPDLTSSRRLSLMAGKGQTPALLITKPEDTGIKTATTRWQVASPPASQSLFSHPAFPQQAPSLAWQVALTRNRQGPVDKNWYLEFPSYEQPLHKSANKAFHFCLPSPFRNRKSAPFATARKAA